MANELEALQAKETAVQQFLASAETESIGAFAASSRPGVNVVGIGVGRKTVHGQHSDELSVRFYVERKLPRTAVNRAHMLPTMIDGVPTDVVETGRFHRLPTAAAPAAA